MNRLREVKYHIVDEIHIAEKPMNPLQKKTDMDSIVNIDALHSNILIFTKHKC